jgi:hypothetical protein
MRHLGQGEDIAGCELVPDIPRARGAEVFFLVDLGCRECAPVWSARHGISVLVDGGSVFNDGRVASPESALCETHALSRFPHFPPDGSGKRRWALASGGEASG